MTEILLIINDNYFFPGHSREFMTNPDKRQIRSALFDFFRIRMHLLLDNAENAGLGIVF